jgi:hypothetical protein
MDTTAAILSAVLEWGYTYTLSFNVARRSTLGGNYRISLLAGGTELASTNGTPTLTDFSESNMIVFKVGPGHTALVGQPLVIRLAVDTALQPHWDNIMLRAEPTPCGTVFKFR